MGGFPGREMPTTLDRGNGLRSGKLLFSNALAGLFARSSAVAKRLQSEAHVTNLQ
jgi:hypothetical protein